MDKMRDLSEVLEEVKGVENGFATMIVPVLKDSIKDGNQHNKRLYIIIMMLVLALVIVSVTSMIIITTQNQKYTEFLKEFEFQTELVQDFDVNDSGNIYNPVLNNTK